MSITADLHARLRAALPEAVPVLTPEEAETPNRGAGKGQTPGIAGYLQREAPQGYVQIEAPQPISSDGLTDVYWVPVASLALDQATCAALARAVDLALNGPPDEPGPHMRVFGDQPRRTPAGFFLARPTYDALTIGGFTAAQE